MSGAQIGGVIGGVIGFVWGGGNWQLGYAIGSAIGGAIDPERIAGPKMGDIARQTANEGVPCPLFAGTAGQFSALATLRLADLMTRLATPARP